ncbi:hypothetical protein FLAG1_01056 [Fusarium langsethiae]|uniref:DNA/RNA-binding domain-containing protein n=1 Tax=Fusarium langsethiae TaxID=179993 RepID=A0A0N0DHT4_FUSLA|nr:hypothetical protein FLAG1_01056 [Fusarium langsethiae]
MSIPIQRIPRDRGPPLPKSGGTPFVGPRRDMTLFIWLLSGLALWIKYREVAQRCWMQLALNALMIWESAQCNGNENIGKAMRQPETRPISQDQLITEVKGIYAGLVMVETKCIEVDNALSSGANTDANKLNNEQWQALISLHRTLLHEHHDFFFATQHPSASPALRRLASKYSMPARMWKHGIHSFLELLRCRLPSSHAIEHMLTFLYLAYSMMALLYETVPAFEDTWIECLGDLGRYRMAIEDDDIQDREVWTEVSKHWSLIVPIPFSNARESIMPLFDPLLANNPPRLAPIDSAFVRAHGILFSSGQRESTEWLKRGSSHPSLSKSMDEWPEKDYIYISLILNSLLLDKSLEQAPRTLPDDFAMRGLLHCEDYFPQDWFGYDTGCHLDFDPLVLEPDSLPPSRRIDWVESISELFWLPYSYRCYLTTKALHSVSNYLATLASVRFATAHRYFDGFLYATKAVF